MGLKTAVLVIEHAATSDNRDYSLKKLWGKMNSKKSLYESIYRRNVCSLRDLDYWRLDRSLVMARHLTWNSRSTVHRSGIWAFWVERTQGNHGSGAVAVRLLGWSERWPELFSHLSQTRYPIHCSGSGRGWHWSTRNLAVGIFPAPASRPGDGPLCWCPDLHTGPGRRDRYAQPRVA